MPQPQKNTVHRLSIDGYSSEGAGVARLDGLVVFVPGALRGEVCEVQLLKVNKNIAFGKVNQVVTPSPARLTPDCPYFGKCGGCQTRHMTYEEELCFKRSKVEDALRRIGGAELSVPVILGAENTLRYRNKIQFPVSDGPKLGFYRPRSHDVLDVDDCLLQPESAGAIRHVVKRWMDTFHISAYDEKTGRGLVRHLYVRASSAGACLCCLVINGKKLPHEQDLADALMVSVPSLTGVLLNVNTKDTNVILGDEYRVLRGDAYLEDTLCSLTFRLSVPSFFQVNRAQTEVLYGKALEFAALTGAETVLDLYCGIGTISLAMARHAKKVYGAEIVPEAVEDARKNALRNRIENVEFFCADAGDAAQRLANIGVHPDIVSVDPPRKGLAAEVVDVVAAMSPRRIVYVSCDPATLARDVKRFTERGYLVQNAVAVDLFPRTQHTECCVRLERLKGL